MTKVVEASVSSTEKVTRIYTPLNIAEQTQVSGFAFSKKMAKKAGLKRKDISRAFFEGSRVFEHAELARKLESDSAGGSTVGENSITIWIDADHANAGSEADYIWMYFGLEKRIKLWGTDRTRFPAGYTLTWDLNDLSDWLEDHIETDLWDEIALVTDSGDGFKIDRIRIIHSGQTLVDWECGLWLDGSKLEEYGKLVLTGKIMETKLDQIGSLWVPQIHWGAREIGKTDGSKYGSTGAWCSEFASWCLQKAMWDTPAGNIGSQSMEDYFSDIGRMYTHDQLIDGEYQLVAGDYIRFEWASGGQHSGIFIEYIDDPSSPTDGTTVRTIEGNASSTVKVTSRTFTDVLSLGNCQ